MWFVILIVKIWQIGKKRDVVMSEYTSKEVHIYKLIIKNILVKSLILRTAMTYPKQANEDSTHHHHYYCANIVARISYRERITY